MTSSFLGWPLRPPAPEGMVRDLLPITRLASPTISPRVWFVTSSPWRWPLRPFVPDCQGYGYRPPPFCCASPAGILILLRGRSAKHPFRGASFFISSQFQWDYVPFFGPISHDLIDIIFVPTSLDYRAQVLPLLRSTRRGRLFGF